MDPFDAFLLGVALLLLVYYLRPAAARTTDGHFQQPRPHQLQPYRAPGPVQLPLWGNFPEFFVNLERIDVWLFELAQEFGIFSRFLIPPHQVYVLNTPELWSVVLGSKSASAQGHWQRIEKLFFEGRTLDGKVLTLLKSSVEKSNLVNLANEHIPQLIADLKKAGPKVNVVPILDRFVFQLFIEFFTGKKVNVPDHVLSTWHNLVSSATEEFYNIDKQNLPAGESHRALNATMDSYFREEIFSDILDGQEFALSRDCLMFLLFEHATPLSGHLAILLHTAAKVDVGAIVNEVRKQPTNATNLPLLSAFQREGVRLFPFYNRVHLVNKEHLKLPTGDTVPSNAAIWMSPFVLGRSSLFGAETAVFHPQGLIQQTEWNSIVDLFSGCSERNVLPSAALMSVSTNAMMQIFKQFDIREGEEEPQCAPAFCLRFQTVQIELA